MIECENFIETTMRWLQVEGCLALRIVAESLEVILLSV